MKLPVGLARIKSHIPEDEVGQRRISSWEQLCALLTLCSFYSGYYWMFRGVTDASHKLVPKIGRDERKRKPGGRITYSRADEVAVHELFKARARPYIDSEPKTELEWLALAQHHGAPTRLLDWTDGLLIAAWFAVRNSGFASWHDPQSQKLKLTRVDAAIWVTCNLTKASKRDHDRPFDVDKVVAYRPHHLDSRIAAQQSVFTLQPGPTNPLDINTVKIVIASETCFTIRKRLDAAGVSERALFPDMAGLGSDLAWRYKNNYVKGYRTDDKYDGK
jgi:hypothetical protein